MRLPGATVQPGADGHASSADSPSPPGSFSDALAPARASSARAEAAADRVRRLRRRTCCRACSASRRAASRSGTQSSALRVSCAATLSAAAPRSTASRARRRSRAHGRSCATAASPISIPAEARWPSRPPTPAVEPALACSTQRDGTLPSERSSTQQADVPLPTRTNASFDRQRSRAGARGAAPCRARVAVAQPAPRDHAERARELRGRHRFDRRAPAVVLREGEHDTPRRASDGDVLEVPARGSGMHRDGRARRCQRHNAASVAERVSAAGTNRPPSRARGTRRRRGRRS